MAPRQRSRRLRSLGDPARAGRVHRIRCFYTATGEKTYTGRYVTDVITDLAHRVPQGSAAQQAVLPDAAPQGAASAVGAGRARIARSSPTSGFPSRETLWDSYATRTDALHENQQRVAGDLTRRDLKLAPPPGSTGPSSRAGSHEARHGHDHARRQEVTLTGEALARWKYQRYMQDYLATMQSVDDNVGRLLDYLDAAGLARNTSSFTRAIRASSSATTACSTSGSCTRSRCGCRFSCAGRRRSRQDRAATRWR